MKRAVLLLSFVIACGGGAEHSRFPPRGDGCQVIEYQESPLAPVHVIGRVRASCGRSSSADDCRRTLKDEVCKLGGDVVYDVKSAEGEDERTILTARAAHTKS